MTSLIVLLIGFRIAFGLSQAPWMVMTLMVGYATVYVLAALTFWGLVGQLFHVRQSKRLFGLLGSGSEISDLTGGVLTLLLAPRVGAPNLLLFATGGLLLALILLQVIVRRYPLGVDQSEDRGNDQAAPGMAGLVALPYVRLLLALVICSQLGYFFVEQIFYSFSMAHFSGADQFSALVGATVAASSLLTVLLQVSAAGPWLRHFGMRGGLLVLPTLILLGALGVSVAGFLFGPIMVVFGLMLGLRVSERAIRFSLDETVVQIAYQPLPASRRSTLQTLIDGGVRPLTAGVAGAGLLILTNLIGFDVLQLTGLLALIGLVWLIIAVRLGHNYPQALLAALTGHRLRSTDLRLDDSDSLAQIERSLHSPHANEALYALQLLTELDHSRLGYALADLLRHPDPQVRREALRRIGSGTEPGTPQEMITHLRHALSTLLDHERDPAVRGAALQTLASLGGGSAAEFEAALHDPAPEVQRGALLALALHWSPSQLEAQIRRWAQAPDPAERRNAALVLATLGQTAWADLLPPLLADQAPTVRQAALSAVAPLGAASHWPTVVAALAHPELRTAAQASLVAGGPAALPALNAAISNPAHPLAARLQYARAAGRCGPAAGAMLVDLIATPDEELRTGVVAALSHTGYQADQSTAPKVWHQIRAEAEAATWVLTVRRDLTEQPNLAILCTALADSAWCARSRMLHLLSCVIEPQAMARIQTGLSQGREQQAYASEVLELLLPAAYRPLVMPLIEASQPTEALNALERHFPQAREAPEARLATLSQGVPGQHVWIQICALAANPSAHTPNPIPEQELFRRVQLLKASTIFAAVPAEALLPVAAMLEPVQYEAGEAIFTQGDPGNCAYLIARGRVAAADGRRIRTELGAYALVGELAVLDGRPRSLSVTALEACELLRLDREPFFELLANYATVAQDVMAMLIRHLRSNLRELKTLHNP
ncbi:MAG: HEAT repeat domain-containing protein [Oscillochloridaceae bacterium umkhey_bin13]